MESKRGPGLAALQGDNSRRRKLKDGGKKIVEKKFCYSKLVCQRKIEKEIELWVL